MHDCTNPNQHTRSYLLRFNSCCVFTTEAELCDGDVIQDDVEILGSLCQLLANQQRHLLTLCDQLRGIELGNHALQHLCTGSTNRL